MEDKSLPSFRHIYNRDDFDAISFDEFLGDSPELTQFSESPVEHSLSPASYTTPGSYVAVSPIANTNDSTLVQISDSIQSLIPDTDWEIAPAALFAGFELFEDMEPYGGNAVIAQKEVEEVEEDKPKPRRKGNRKTGGAGPNKYGRTGTKRCEQCRKWRRKVIVNYSQLTVVQVR